MLMQKIFINIIVAIIEILIIDIIYTVFGEKKKNYIAYFLPIALVYVAFSIIATIYINTPLLLIPINCVIIITFASAYRIKPLKAIFVLLIYYVMQLALEMLVVLTLSALNKISVNEFQQNIYLYLEASLIIKLSSYLIVQLIKGLQNDFRSFIMSRHGILFLFIPTASLFTLGALSTIIYHSTNKVGQLLVIVASVCLITANVATFNIYDYMVKQINKKHYAETREIMLTQQMQNYGQIISINRDANKKEHDIKHQLYAINELLGSDAESAKQIIANMCKVIENYKVIQYTGIDAVDSLLNVKKRECIDKGIEIYINSFLLESNVIDKMDLCVIFGNLIDNAIESSEKISDSAKVINISCIQQGKYLSINVTNSAELNEIGDIGKTTKTNKLKHGFGLENVKEIVVKYGGDISIERSEHTFTTVILMKNFVENYQILH